MGKISTRVVRRVNGKKFPRENVEAEIKTFGRDGMWTQLDMNALSFSWKPPVDR
jgi:hypothetical protein